MKHVQLIRIATEDGLYLHGAFVPQPGKTALLHIHGFNGNFYENAFLTILAEQLETLGITYLSGNTRGAGKDTDFLTTEGGYKRVGGQYEKLEDAYKDIDAWILFLHEQGYEEIILQGHSLGTFKAVRYLFEGKHAVKKLILLAPFDKTAIITHASENKWREHLRYAEKQIHDGNGEEMVPLGYEEYRMSYQTFVSWYKESDLSHLFDFSNKTYTFPVLRQISVPTKIIVGSKDRHFHMSNPEHPEEALEILLKNIPHAEGIIIRDALHSFAPKENELVQEIVSFITT